MTTTISPTDIVTFWREAGKDRWWKKDDAFYHAALNKRFDAGRLEMMVPKYHSILDEFIND